MKKFVVKTIESKKKAKNCGKYVSVECIFWIRWHVRTKRKTDQQRDYLSYQKFRLDKFFILN